MTPKIYGLMAFLSLFFLQKPDISTNNTYSEIYKEIDRFDSDDISAFKHINILIKKAKLEKNYTQLYRAYREAAAFAPEDLELQYADSGVWAAKHTQDHILLGNAYLTYGLSFNGKRKYDKALENYLIADEYLYTTNDSIGRYKLLIAIGQLKNYLGMYSEAVPLLDSANRYFSKLLKKSDSSLYLVSLNGLKDIYIDLGDYEKATQMYYQGKAINMGYKSIYIESGLDLYEGYNQYKQKNYTKAIELINASLPGFEKKEDFSRTSMVDCYLGLCYFDMGEKEKGIAHFKKMDSVFVKENYTRPRFRAAYEKMIDYYKANNQPKEQLWAVNQLLAVDETLNSYFKNLSTQLKQAYDTQQLLREKAQLEKSFEAENTKSTYTIIALGLFGVVAFGFGSYYFRSKNSYKKEYNTLLELQQERRNATQENDSIEEDAKIVQAVPIKTQQAKTTSSISDEVTQDILQKLNTFEEEQKFLDKKLTQSKLAKNLKTNTTYLAQIIKDKKGCTYAKYINQLRVQFLLNLLEKEPKYRQFTVKSIAEECGFNNTKTFRTAFKEVTKMPYAYFIKKYVKDNS